MTSLPKERLDQILTDRGLCTSRTQAQSLVLQGKVKVNGIVVQKPGSRFNALDPALTVEVGDNPCPFVSRGGLKLLHGLKTFNLYPVGATCLDIGASTGGFTDCLLKNGAKHVYAVDVGYGQLDWGLRQDPRVTPMERSNIRKLSPEAIPEKIDWVVADVSFISLKKVLPSALQWLKPDGVMVVLVKPQFEYLDYVSNLNNGEKSLEKRFDGVIRDHTVREIILNRVQEDLDDCLPGWTCVQSTESPIQGQKGNVEFLLHIAPSGASSNRFELSPAP